MRVEAERAAVKHADTVEDLLAKHSKELEDAGLSAPICCKFCLILQYTVVLA